MLELRRAERLLLHACLTLTLACGAPERGGENATEEGSPEAGQATLLQATEADLYRVAFRPRDGDAPLGQLHAWVFHVETVEGTLFQPVRLAVSGGMPQHGHGFVTEPRVTRVLGNGDFLVEGVKFHMAGDWTFRFEVVGPAGPDVAIFRVQVDP
jgi:hypothetical protein